MKHLVSIFTFLILATLVSAQIKTIPKDLSPKRKITGTQNVTTGYEHAKMDVYITQTEGKGETLNFSSSVIINMVELSFIGIDNSKQTTFSKNKTGSFYLQTPAYEGGLKNGYTLHFYTSNSQRKSKPIWTFTVGPKK